MKKSIKKINPGDKITVLGQSFTVKSIKIKSNNDYHVEGLANNGTIVPLVFSDDEWV